MQKETYQFHLNDLPEIASEILNQFKHSVCTFKGEMGSGKTTFIKAILKNLSCDDSGNSPTFSIINEYKSPKSPIYHMDCYRIEHIDEAWEIGIEEYLYSGNLCFIEWPSKIIDLLPPNRHEIELKVLSDKKRKLIFS